MEGLTLATGIILMLVAAIGVVFYVGLVIAIPVCRLLDWFFDKETDEPVSRPSRVGRLRSAASKWACEVVRRTVAYCRRDDRRS
jgi:hypothetical protein